METYIKFKNLSFKYPGSDVYALSDINLTIGRGELVLVCGKSGCGKTTLLRQLKKPLIPHGYLRGSVTIDGESVRSFDTERDTKTIGFVMQNPDSQLVTDKVWHELAFGLESLGFENTEIRRRVAEAASFFGIEDLFHKKVSELSGGKKQLLNLAAVMVMLPEVLVLDEPTAYLDPIAADDFLRAVYRINSELGVTVIMSAHRGGEIMPLCTKTVIMDGGQIIACGSAREAGEYLKARGSDMLGVMPAAMRIYAAVENDLTCPLTVNEGREWLNEFAKTHELKDTEEKAYVPTGDNIIEARGVCFSYDKNTADVIRGLDLNVPRGAVYAVVGGNGTGKSTLLSLIAGVNKLQRGTIKINCDDKGRRAVLLPQNPRSLFVKDTVYDELAETGSNENAVSEAIKLFGFSGMESRNPCDLSGGEQQRLAIAKVMLLNPRILLLDEPTKGIDPGFKRELGLILRILRNNGVTIVMVTHDIEFCAAYADMTAMLFDGMIISEADTRSFLKTNSFYTTDARKIAALRLENAVTAEELIRACGGRCDGEPRGDSNDFFNAVNSEDGGTEETEKRSWRKSIREFLFARINIPKGGVKLRNIYPALLSAAAVLVTVLFGIYYLGDSKYYFISLLIIPEILVPFFCSFEKKRPSARELVIISVMSAATVAARSAFYMLPQVKPMAAVIVISGIAFGGEAGFLVGAVSAFVSNIFFGQGPWTPWQMTAFGFIGLMSGALFNAGVIRRTRLSAALSGFFLTLIIYGGIMNLSSALVYRLNIQLAFKQGLPFDLIHAAAVGVFLFFGAKAFLERMNRIKAKYGVFLE